MFHVHLQSAFQETFFLFQIEELLSKRTFCFSSSASTKARVSLSAWIYVSFATVMFIMMMDRTMMMLRMIMLVDCNGMEMMMMVGN